MIGQTISHYQILEKLGEGGMGVVYKASDLKLNRTVALKFLPPQLTDDPSAKSRFLQEARTVSTLDHVNIGTVYDVDEANGQMFIAMAYYEGETLGSRIRRARAEGLFVPVPEALDIAAQVAQGLAEAHRKEIIHRDIKSDNIVLTGDRVKIMDFGLAKLKDSPRYTQSGSLVGTLAYMSPEQIRGEPVDHRADIFSFGVLFYELLTGDLPFRAEHQAALTYAIAHSAPTPPRSPRGWS
ncbi:MAG: serine/threonine protein kinase [Ignavibacteria bacterium]|nr:serine/threonine protein kinase [Ignavibacteria bacterium]